MDARTDAELIACILNGDQELYAVLVRRYQEALYWHAVGMVSDPDAAADLVQDSFIKAFLKLNRCNDPARFRSWIFRIVSNRCKDHLKDWKQQMVSLAEDTAFVAERYGPEAELARIEVQGAVERALAMLPEAQREAFLLKHLEGLSYEEMAEMLGASVSALKMRVSRAREILHELLTQGEIWSTR